MKLEDILKAAKGKLITKKPKKNIGKKIVAASLATILAFGTAEFTLRWYGKHSDSALFMNLIPDSKESPVVGGKYKPHEIVFESKCNSQGYFDEQEFIIAKKPEVKRVVVIADSFGVKYVPIKYHAFTKAENLEGKFGNPKWEIYNLSRDGTNPEAYLYTLREHALNCNPDLTLIGFFCGNDLDVFYAPYIQGINVKKITSSTIKEKWNLSEKIRILRTMKRLYKIYKAGYLFGEKGKRVIAKDKAELEKLVDVHPEKWWQDINNESPFMSDEKCVDKHMEYFNHNLSSIESGPYLRLKAIFGEMKELTNNKLAVVLFPTALEVEDNIYNKIILKDKKYLNVDKDRVYNNVRSILKQQNIPVIDLLEPLKQGQKEHGRVYHLNDTHLNYWGNDIAAKEMRKFIESYFRAEKEKEKVIEKKNE